MFPTHDKIDLSSYNIVTANSNYTAKWILKKWGYQAEVVYFRHVGFIGQVLKRKT